MLLFDCCMASHVHHRGTGTTYIHKHFSARSRLCRPAAHGGISRPALQEVSCGRRGKHDAGDHPALLLYHDRRLGVFSCSLSTNNRRCSRHGRAHHRTRPHLGSAGGLLVRCVDMAEQRKGLRTTKMPAFGRNIAHPVRHDIFVRYTK